ncbi:hypothetical protein FB451DRAFT_1224758 [Mycena latifolia]|nr:hypothetical protein FB451DRAFT_1224758 [Mycena latifolia]
MAGKKRVSKNEHNRGALANVAGKELPVTLAGLLAVVRTPASREAQVTEISRLICIPDYNTARGLKQCHETFDIISSKLDKAFALSRGCQADIVATDTLAAMIIVIYGRMGFDTILRKRIFGETEFLKKAISLLHSDTARSTVMHILSDVTHIGTDILKNLSRFTSNILDCVEGHTDDLPYLEKAVCVLSHSTVVVLNNPEPDPELAALVSPDRILSFFLSVVRLPTATSLSFDHFCIFCSQTTKYHPAAFQSIPDSVDLLVACTRSQDLCIRNDALRSLIKLHFFESTQDSPPQEISGQPESVRQALDQYGRDKSSETRDREDGSALMDLVDTFSDNPRRSLSDFGSSLVEVILRNEFRVRNHFNFNDPLEEDIRLATDLGGTQFVDVLRLCGDAVRRSGTGSHTDVMANILQLEFLLSSDKEDEAFTVARSCIERHPSVGFFYYVLATCGATRDTVACLRSAEKGLQCTGLTDFLREELLYYAVFSSDVIIAEMLTGRASEIRFQEVVALINKARSNAISFVNDAPPDHPKMPLMIAIGIHLAILVGSGTMSDDYTELQTAHGKLSLAYDIARSQVSGFCPGRQCLALDTIFARMSIAWRVWKPVVSRQPTKFYPSTGIEPNVDLAAWLEKLDTSDPTTTFLELRGLNPDAERYGVAALHCCSACNLPSAVLKRCSRCQKTRYCNSVCQRQHWTVHRKACNPNPTQ